MENMATVFVYPETACYWIYNTQTVLPQVDFITPIQNTVIWKPHPFLKWPVQSRIFQDNTLLFILLFSGHWQPIRRHSALILRLISFVSKYFVFILHCLE